MNENHTDTTPLVTTDDTTGLAGMWQVILFNDDHNTVDHVVACLRRIFGHQVKAALAAIEGAADRLRQRARERPGAALGVARRPEGSVVDA